MKSKAEFKAYTIVGRISMASENTGSETYFEEVTDSWDDMRNSFFPDSVRERAYEAAAVEKGREAADIGAGTGFIAEGLLKRGVNVIAIDRSGGMLNKIKEKFNAYDTIDYKIGEAEILPLDDGSVDYAFANMCLHHVDDPESAIQEMTRILRPKGKLIITDLDEHNHDFLRTEQHDRWLGFKREDIKRWFKEAGLRNVKVDCANADCCADSSCGCDKANISIFLAYGEKQRYKSL